MADNLDDLCSVGQPPEDIDVVATPIIDNPIIVLAAPDHPLANKTKISLERIAREPWLMREKGSGTRNAIEGILTGHGINIHPRLELGSNEAIKQAILAGLRISALSRHALTLNQPGQSRFSSDVSKKDGSTEISGGTTGNCSYSWPRRWTVLPRGRCSPA